MKESDGVALIADAVRGHPGVWADLGAGEGTFTLALANLLGPESRIYAVDRDAQALARLAARAAPNVIPVLADFSKPFDLPGFDEWKVDGMVLANALHFVPDAESVLARLATRLRPGGRMVFVEYDRRAASRWVPYPIPAARLPGLAASAGLCEPTFTAKRPSSFGGDLYVAVAERPALPGARRG